MWRTVFLIFLLLLLILSSEAFPQVAGSPYDAAGAAAAYAAAGTALGCNVLTDFSVGGRCNTTGTSYNLVANGTVNSSGVTTGGTDNAPNLLYISQHLIPANGETLNFPKGNYNFGSMVSFIGKQVDFRCEGNPGGGGVSTPDGSTNFLGTNAAAASYQEAIIKFGATSPSSASYNNGGHIRGCNFSDATSNSSVSILLEVNQEEGVVVEDNTFESSPGRTYNTGTATFTNGSTTVTLSGSGGTWQSYFAPGFISFQGFLYELQQCTAGSAGTGQCTIPTQWQAATSTGAYTINYGSIAIGQTLPTSSTATTFNQYNYFINNHFEDVKYWFYQASAITDEGTVSGSSASSLGASRNEIYGSHGNCLLPDSIAIYGGPFTDTTSVFGGSQNNCTIGVYLLGAHANTIYNFKSEQNSGTIVSGNSTCSAGVGSNTCTYGEVVMGGDYAYASDNNSIRDPYCNACGVGTAIMAGAGLLTGTTAGGSATPYPPRQTFIDMPQVSPSGSTLYTDGGYVGCTSASNCGTTILTPQHFIHAGTTVY